MRKLTLSLSLVLFMSATVFAQIVGGLKLGQTYTFESESGTNLFMSYQNTVGRVVLNGPNKNFKIVAPLNGRKGFVSFQAIDISDKAYVVMAEACSRPYTKSNYYNVSMLPSNPDETFNNNASFEVLSGRSNTKSSELISFRVKNGTHFFKREQGVFMDAPGAGVAPRYMNHFTWKTKKIAESAKQTLSCEGGDFKVDNDNKIWQKINGSWVHVGDRCKELICNRRRVFCVSEDGSLWRYNGKPNQWTRANTLLVGQKLNAGKKMGGAHFLTSSNGKHFFYMQENGDVGIWTHDPKPRNIWSSKTSPQTNCTLVMQEDGNLVVYNEANQPIWSSETHPHWDQKYSMKKYKPTRLVLEQDGTAVLYSDENYRVWTNKDGKLPLN